MIKVFVFSKLVCSLCHTAAKQIRLDGEIKVYPLFCACGGEIIEKDVNETYETEEKREPLISIEQALQMQPILSIPDRIYIDADETKYRVIRTPYGHFAVRGMAAVKNGWRSTTQFQSCYVDFETAQTKLNDKAAKKGWREI